MPEFCILPNSGICQNTVLPDATILQFHFAGCYVLGFILQHYQPWRRPTDKTQLHLVILTIATFLILEIEIIVENGRQPQVRPYPHPSATSTHGHDLNGTPSHVEGSSWGSTFTEVVQYQSICPLLQWKIQWKKTLTQSHIVHKTNPLSSKKEKQFSSYR